VYINDAGQLFDSLLPSKERASIALNHLIYMILLMANI